MNTDSVAPAAAARLSLRAAIDAKCKSCHYDPAARGGWREQVGKCLTMDCPLYAVRPMPRKAAP